MDIQPSGRSIYPLVLLAAWASGGCQQPPSSDKQIEAILASRKAIFQLLEGVTDAKSAQAAAAPIKSQLERHDAVLTDAREAMSPELLMRMGGKYAPALEQSEKRKWELVHQVEEHAKGTDLELIVELLREPW